MCPVIISTHISKMLSTAESKRPWRAKTGLSVHEGAGGRRDFERFFLRSTGPQCGAGNIQCRRFGTPEDLGKVLVFLASDAAGYMNGCHVEISGGKRCVQNPQFSYQ